MFNLRNQNANKDDLFSSIGFFLEVSYENDLSLPPRNDTASHHSKNSIEVFLINQNIVNQLNKIIRNMVMVAIICRCHL